MLHIQGSIENQLPYESLANSHSRDFDKIKFDKMLKRHLYQKRILYTVYSLIEAFILKTLILNGFSLTIQPRFVKFVKLSLRQSFPIYGSYAKWTPCLNITIAIIRSYVLNDKERQLIHSQQLWEQLLLYNYFCVSYELWIYLLWTYIGVHYEVHNYFLSTYIIIIIYSFHKTVYLSDHN